MWRAGRWGRRGMDQDNLQLWGGHQPHAGACALPIGLGGTELIFRNQFVA